jgi:hypothetical protein
MKEKHIISNLQNATAIYYQSIETTVLKEAEARQRQFLDADYLDDYTHMETHPSNLQQANLICSLQQYPKKFCGGLGVFNVPSVHLELRPKFFHAF